MSIYNDYKVCDNCGRINNSDNRHCLQCGANIELIKIEKDTYTRDLESLIGENSEYYIEKLNTMKEKNRNYSWNWPAFLVTPCWLLYRKMYGLGLGLIALSTIFQYTPLDTSIINIIIYIPIGLFANTVYIKHIEKQMKKLEELDENSKSEFIRKKGGVSMPILILIFAVLFIVEFIFQWFFT